MSRALAIVLVLTFAGSARADNEETLAGYVRRAAEAIESRCDAHGIACRVLGLSRSFTPAELKTAKRRGLRETQPDANNTADMLPLKLVIASKELLEADNGERPKAEDHMIAMGNLAAERLGKRPRAQPRQEPPLSGGLSPRDRQIYEQIHRTVEVLMSFPNDPFYLVLELEQLHRLASTLENPTLSATLMNKFAAEIAIYGGIPPAGAHPRAAPRSQTSADDLVRNAIDSALNEPRFHDLRDTVRRSRQARPRPPPGAQRRGSTR